MDRLADAVFRSVFKQQFWTERICAVVGEVVGWECCFVVGVGSMSADFRSSEVEFVGSRRC